MSFLEAVPPAHAGAYAYLNRCLTTARTGAMPVASLTAEDQFAGVLARYAATFEGCDRRAIGSMWWQYYVSLLLPPAIVLRLRGTTIATHPLCATIDDCGFVTGFEVTLGDDVPDRDEVWLASLLRDACEQVARALGMLTGVSRRTLWANAASRLDDLRPWLSGFDHEASRRLARLLGAARLDQLPNPLFGMIRDGRPRLCCLRDQLPGFETCGNCPNAIIRLSAEIEPEAEERSPQMARAKEVRPANQRLIDRRALIR